MHVQLPSQVQPYLYVYIDLILQYYMFRLDAINRYYRAPKTSRQQQNTIKHPHQLAMPRDRQTPKGSGNTVADIR
jgi:hypothetical protein